MSNLYLSKSLYIRGLQCRKSLYLHKFHPELKDEVSEEQEQVYQIGYDVGSYAKKLFPEGIEISYEDYSPSEQVEMTSGEILKGTRTIYEAAFSYDDIFIKADIIHKGSNGWEIYEVKSSSSVKDHQIDDLSVQVYVVKGAGLPIAKAAVIHVNTDYIRHGEIDVHSLFKIEDITETVKEKEQYVKESIAEIRVMLNGDMPSIDIGEHCESPYSCDFMGHCWKHIPQEYSVFDLRGRGLNGYELYRQGIINLKDIPTEELNFQQKLQVEGISKKQDYIDRDALREFLVSLWHPIYFLDFECLYGIPIPPFDGTQAYQHIPFQYSLHYLKEPNGTPGHSDFLAEPREDGRLRLLEKLLDEIPENACIVAFNAPYEGRILRGLAESFPQHESKIYRIIDNLYDLAIPFRSKYLYLWQMNGSYSLKVVLPLLVPEMSYSELEVSNGEDAMRAYLKTWDMDDKDQINVVRQALLTYCRQDSLGIVRLFQKLHELSR